MSLNYTIKKPFEIPEKGGSMAAIAHNCSDWYFATTVNNLTDAEFKALISYDFNSNKWIGLRSNSRVKEYYILNQ